VRFQTAVRTEQINVHNGTLTQKPETQNKFLIAIDKVLLQSDLIVFEPNLINQFNLKPLQPHNFRYFPSHFCGNDTKTQSQIELTKICFLQFIALCVCNLMCCYSCFIFCDCFYREWLKEGKWSYCFTKHWNTIKTGGSDGEPKYSLSVDSYTESTDSNSSAVHDVKVCVLNETGNADLTRERERERVNRNQRAEKGKEPWHNVGKDIKPNCYEIQNIYTENLK
jgi:hypothetical protein